MFRSTLVHALTLAGLLGSPALAQATASHAVAQPAPGVAGMTLLYVWDASIPGDSRATRRLLHFARAQGFDTLAIEAAPVGYGEPGALERYRRFSLLARASGMRVLALSGFPWFTVSATAGIPDQPTAHEEGWSLYQACMTSRLFDGLLDDSSPVETNYVRSDGTSGNYFWEHPALAAQDYLDWVRGLATLAGARLHVQATPMWFDDHPAVESLFLDGETEPRSLASYVASQADLVNVLAYRDRASAILEGARNELALGPVLIGVETLDLGPAMDHVTFFEEGRRFLVGELVEVWERARGQHGFRGLSLHHYGSLREMGLTGPQPGHAR